MRGALFLLAVITLLSAQACAPGFSWPKVVQSCAPSPVAVVEDVFEILSGEGPVDDPLVELAKRNGAEIVLCTVHELVEQLSRAKAAPSVAAQRGREFLARTGSRVEDGP